MERALLLFEKKLPSTNIKKFPITLSAIEEPEKTLESLLATSDNDQWSARFEQVEKEENNSVKEYVTRNRQTIGAKHNLTMTPSRINIVTAYYCKHIIDIGNGVKKVKDIYDEIKKIELYFFNKHDINIVLEEEAIDYIIEELINHSITVESLYQKLAADFEYGLKLVQDKTGRSRFFLTKEALQSPEDFLSSLIKNELTEQ